MKKQLPNLITLLNLLSGSIAAYHASNGRLETAGYFILLGILFDFLDGFAARLLKTQSPLGKELDSLADMVTSGLAPGIIMFQLLRHAVFSWDVSGWNIIPYAGFLLTLGAAYRLAAFNISPDDRSYFKGLPTPAMSLLTLSLPFVRHYGPGWLMPATYSLVFLLLIIVFSVVFMNLPIRMFTLKFENYSPSRNRLKYLFIILSGIILFFFRFGAFLLIIPLYVLLSLFALPKKS